MDQVGFPFVRRCENNPILGKKDIPYPAELVFNAGVCKYRGRYVMCFRNDYGSTEADFAAGRGHLETNIGFAESGDGVHWEVAPKPVFTYFDDGCRRDEGPRQHDRKRFRDRRHENSAARVHQKKQLTSGEKK
jgi:beta-1,4-mannooligosaccharide/beta-1,4-mannosyl-N-acetylglucosamine phosphorylase